VEGDRQIGKFYIWLIFVYREECYMGDKSLFYKLMPVIRVFGIIRIKPSATSRKKLIITLLGLIGYILLTQTKLMGLPRYTIEFLDKFGSLWGHIVALLYHLVLRLGPYLRQF